MLYRKFQGFLFLGSGENLPKCFYHIIMGMAAILVSIPEPFEQTLVPTTLRRLI